jgi:hypothetical protein
MSSKTEIRSNILSECNAINWEYYHTETLLKKIIYGELLVLEQYKKRLLKRIEWLDERFSFLLNELEEMKRDNVWMVKG